MAQNYINFKYIQKNSDSWYDAVICERWINQKSQRKVTSHEQKKSKNNTKKMKKKIKSLVYFYPSVTIAVLLPIGLFADSVYINIYAPGGFCAVC